MGRLRIDDDIVRYLSTFQRLGETVEVELAGRAAADRARTVFRALRTRAAAQIGVGLGVAVLARAPARPGRRPRSCRAATCPFLTNVTPRNWTMVGNVGSPWEAIVDPRGLVTPWFDGWSLDWWIGADDRWHFPSREAAVRQRLVDALHRWSRRRCACPAATPCSGRTRSGAGGDEASWSSSRSRTVDGCRSSSRSRSARTTPRASR